MSFAARFGRAAAATGSAPGRVNLIGEHTDYNDGFVLPLAFGLHTEAAIALRTDGVVRAVSASRPADAAEAQYQRRTEARTGGWIDYVQGVTQALDQRDVDVPGFDLFVASTIPIGAGLASSAALTVSVLRALRTLCRLRLSDLELATIAHHAETDLVGAPVGVMDQMAVSLGDAAHALCIDTRRRRVDPVPWPANASLIIVHSGMTHDHSRGDYRVRRAECAEAVRQLGVTSLRDLTGRDLPRAAALPPPLDRRVRHVVTENARVLAAVEAMRAGDVPALGRLWLDSHASQRDDFETSIPVVDEIVEIACAVPGVLGARLTGGGFGGAVIVLASTTSESAIAEAIERAVASRTAGQARVLWPTRP